MWIRDEAGGAAEVAEKKVRLTARSRWNQKCTGGTDMYFQVNELKIGMRATAEQLIHILNKYMILVYDAGDTEGTLVFVGNRQNKEYDRWFMQNKPITPIYHTQIDLEENVDY